MSLYTLLYMKGEIDELDRRLALMRGHDRIRVTETKKRVEALERDLGRVALATRALADLCIAKGLFTQEEFVQRVNDVDALDGIVDQRLGARRVMPGESGPPDPDPKDHPDVKKERIKRRRPYP